MPDLPRDLASQKQKMRAKLRFRRLHFATNLDAVTRLAAFRALPAPIAELLSQFPDIGAYVAMNGEPDILPMLGDLPALALPHHAERAAIMNFRRWQISDQLIEGPWGAQQPADESAPTIPELIFCPLVGFDRRGGRLGQGGGQYDRYFAAHPAAIRIGIGWSVQEVDAIAAESTDIALDAILTEQEFIRCGDRL